MIETTLASLIEAARQGKVVVLAGAGVSAGRPTALPGWKPLNAAIVRALDARLESALERPNWLAQVVADLEAARGADRFPPEYQAQIVEEMAGERYFRALQSLDVDAINAGHDGIAALAAAGALRAVVTTNFDRLIEYALERRGVSHAAAFDEPGFAALSERLAAGEWAPLPVIHIHGSVRAHLSMVDTLKQRKLGRSQRLQACLDRLHPGHWLYLGFSAADLEGDAGYLGLIAGAAGSAGATYVAYPGSPRLGRGAQRLMAAFGERGQVVTAQVAEVLDRACGELGAPGPASIADDVALGRAQFERKLRAWADELTVSAAGLCLAALFEAAGQAEPAVRILDRLVRKELYGERDAPGIRGADYRALQVQYGRLGAAWGRFVAVPDMAGFASNASIETAQSLGRVLDSEVGFIAFAWLASLWLWLNNGQSATQMALQLLNGLVNEQWAGPPPRSDEEAVDAWLSAAQVCLVNAGQETLQLVVSTAEVALERARRCGDVVRAARVGAFYLLALAWTDDDLLALAEEHGKDFAEAERVGDGFALGMRSLALGQWAAGAGGRVLVRDKSPTARDNNDVAQDADPAVRDQNPVALQALEHLGQAVGYFEQQGMDPWVLYAILQQARAFAALDRFDEVRACLDQVDAGLERFPIWASHLYEAVGQLRAMGGNAEAAQSFESAIQAAEESGLDWQRERLQQFLGQG